MLKDFSVPLRVKICVKDRMNANLKTIPEDIRKDCDLDHNVYGYVRKFEKEGVFEVERHGNKYLDIKLTKKGLRQLNDQMLTPYSSDIRSLVLKLDENSAPNVDVDENLINFVVSTKPELNSFIGETVSQMYSTVIPNNFPDEFSPKLDEFFDNKLVNLNNISQN